MATSIFSKGTEAGSSVQEEKEKRKTNSPIFDQALHFCREMVKPDLLYRSELARRLGVTSEQIHLFWKGRVGLYGLLEALGVGPGDEVIVPAFTCVVVPNAIMYLGAKPVYVDVDVKTYNLDSQFIEAVLSPRTKVILAQNTFGLSADLDPVLSIGRQHGIHVLEDCTHGFGGFYKGQANGTIAEAAFFSTQWNKPFSTGLGGFTVANDPKISKRLSDFETKLSTPGLFQRQMLRAQILARRYFLKPSVYWPLLRMYRFLSQKNIISGSSEGRELSGVTMPDQYLKGHSSVQARAGLRALQVLDQRLSRQSRSADFYHDLLGSMGIPTAYEPAYATHTFLKYPLLVKDRDAFFRQAEQARIPVGDWMLSPIHPIRKDYSTWEYHYGSCPNGEYLSRHVVNLPTDVSERELERVGKFLREVDIVDYR
jgi:perosamine synthetase